MSWKFWKRWESQETWCGSGPGESGCVTWPFPMGNDWYHPSMPFVEVEIEWYPTRWRCGHDGHWLTIQKWSCVALGVVSPDAESLPRWKGVSGKGIQLLNLQNHHLFSRVSLIAWLWPFHILDPWVALDGAWMETISRVDDALNNPVINPMVLCQNGSSQSNFQLWTPIEHPNQLHPNRWLRQGAKDQAKWIRTVLSGGGFGGLPLGFLRAPSTNPESYSCKMLVCSLLRKHHVAQCWVQLFTSRLSSGKRTGPSFDGWYAHVVMMCFLNNLAA